MAVFSEDLFFKGGKVNQDYDTLGRLSSTSLVRSDDVVLDQSGDRVYNPRHQFWHEKRVGGADGGLHVR